MVASTDLDEKYMAYALDLAERGRWSVRPNPCVGCVVVKEGEIVGEGFHVRAGEAHAEVIALAAAGEAARGATVYLTLEPCCHQGQTPPCLPKLLDAGIKRLVVAGEDPNPKVSGHSLEQVRQAGIALSVGCQAERAEALNCGFFSRMRRRRPWLRLKMAMSLDGRTADSQGNSKWLTGEIAREDVHQWRAQSCAILSSARTVLADNARLTARPATGDSTVLMQPQRIIVDAHAQIPLTHPICQGPGRTWLIRAACAEHEATPSHHDMVRIATLPTDKDGRIELGQLLQFLGELECNTIWTECGPTLAGALLTAQLADECLIYTAPTLLGEHGRPLFKLDGLTNLSDALMMDIIEVRTLGLDICIAAKLRNH